MERLPSGSTKSWRPSPQLSPQHSSFIIHNVTAAGYSGVRRASRAGFTPNLTAPLARVHGRDTNHGAFAADMSAFLAPNDGLQASGPGHGISRPTTEG